MEYSRRLLAGVLVVAGSFAIAACSSSSSTSPSSSPASASSSTSSTLKPGGISSQNLRLSTPNKNKSATITGTLLNNGLDGNIVKASAPIATKGVVVMDGAESGSIPVPPNGAKPSAVLTADGYHLQLRGIDMSIDPDGEISVTVVTDAGQESLLQAKVN